MVYLTLTLFWIFYQIKNILFWVYLWQLKEYHIGRFIDHFRTVKGKKILFRKFQILKIFFLFFYFLSSFFWIYIVFLIYFFEAGKTFLDLIKKKILKPVFTKKAIFLIFTCLTFTFLYLFIFFEKSEKFLFWLLIFDFCSPAVFSGIVLFFQPLTFFFRFFVIKKAINKRKKFKDLLVVGITGSYGKTSTKEFLFTILEKKFPGKILKTKDNQNSEIGISKCILENLNKNHKIFIVEMGAYNKGSIKLLAKITQPKIAILTGINEQHLALFGSMENLISSEGGKELIDSLPKDGLVIFNGENEILRKIYQETKLKKKIIGIDKKEFDLSATQVEVKKESLSFQIFSKEGERADFNLNLIGKQNIENILLASCCAKELGMTLEEISFAAKNIKMSQSRVVKIKTKSGLNLINTTYSANPSSVISHLEYLKVWEGRKIVVMPCLIELGPASSEIHRKIGQKINEICDLAIITTKDYFKEIKEKAREKAIFLENPKEIFEKIKNFRKENDVILLEGRVPPQLLNFLINSFP